MADATTRENTQLKSSRFSISKGLITVGGATILLFIVSAILAPSSVSVTSLDAMLPIAGVLAIAGLGQMLVVQQGGIDLSVPGAISLALVIVTHNPDGDSSKLVPAILLAVVFAIIAGVVNGLLIGGLGLNAIIATLGTNALLYGVNLALSGGRPRITTSLLASIGGGTTLGIPNILLFAVGALIVVLVLVKKTVAGRRFEGIGANPRAARAVGLRVRLHRSIVYVWAQLLYCLAGILLAGFVAQPTAFAGDTYLLPSVAVVVLGGTSLLGGRGFPIPTVIAAIFLEQLNQFVISLGVTTAIQTLVQAASLAVGVSLYTVNWAGIWARVTKGRRQTPAVAAS
jgi:ribose transport system permease protein